MKRVLFGIFISTMFFQPAFAWSGGHFFDNVFYSREERAVANLLKSQVKFANRADFDKFIATYDSTYVNGDGIDLDNYSKLVKDIWESYEDIKYDIKIQNIEVEGNRAIVKLTETAHALMRMSRVYDGELKSNSNSVYNLEKIGGKWRIVSDSVLDETTTMLYGDAKGLDIKLFVPEQITANTDYTAMLEFVPPDKTIAIASIAADKVEYPQKLPEEVFRALPEDNILERIFTANKDNVDEYIVASIGLTKPSVSKTSVNFSLTGFGYKIKRVNIVNAKENKESDI